MGELRRLLFSPHGRIGRGSYWVGMALSGLMFFSPLLVFVAGTDGRIGAPLEPWAEPLLLLALLLVFVAVWTGHMVSLKRIRDRGQDPRLLVIQHVPVLGWAWAVVNLGLMPAPPQDVSASAPALRRPESIVR